jgi:hypothetical protein
VPAAVVCGDQGDRNLAQPLPLLRRAPVLPVLRTTVAPVLTCRTESALPMRITTGWRPTLGDFWRSV